MNRIHQKNSRINIDPEIRDILPMFIASRWQDVASLQDAMAHEDPSLVCKIGHQLKGSGSSFGFPMISTIGKRLEQAASAGNWQKISHSIDRLINYLVQLEPVLNNQIETPHMA